MLADFGADVIRVERREGGEDRRVGPIVKAAKGAYSSTSTATSAA